ncbi:MAG TPA: hypothetical protein VLA31_06545 [Burkholderiaceae bacterium]|nr:hypothetical protein [Burkholderiaceae bacterium]
MKYRITTLLGGFDMSICPPAIVSALWPTFDGWPVTLSPQECIVTVPDSAPTPADLGPLVKVELVPPSN